MTGADFLRKHANEVRTYETDCNYSMWMEAKTREFAENFPTFPLNGKKVFRVKRRIKQVQKHEYLDIPYHITVRNLVKWAGKPPIDIEEPLGVSMPESFRQFYREVEGALLPLRNLIEIWSPQRVLDETLSYLRRSKSVKRVNLVLFAHTWHGASRFAMRRSPQTGAWRVQLINESESLSHYDEPSWETVPDDASIDAWLERLFQTDGYPMRRGNEEYEEPYLWRVLDV
jgi:hypothetical protein